MTTNKWQQGSHGRDQFFFFFFFGDHFTIEGRQKATFWKIELWALN